MDMVLVDQNVEDRGRRISAIVLCHKLTFFLTSLLVFVPVMWFALHIKPEFTATAQLISGQDTLKASTTSEQKPLEVPAALSLIAESDEVVRAAVEKVGLDTLVASLGPGRPSILSILRRFIPGLPEPSQRTTDRTEEFLPLISRGLAVRSDPKADIIRISYRNPDPIVAAEFANAVAQAVVDRQTQLYSRPGAIDFFDRQRQRFEDDFKRSSDALEQFSTKTGIYAAKDQRELLLKRLNDLSAAMAVTRGDIARESGELQALADSLRKLVPVARSPYVSALVNSFVAGHDDANPAVNRALGDYTTDPPLLLIRVYQDSMASLFKVNADLAGAQALQQQQAAEQANLVAELNTLSGNELRFTELKRASEQADSDLQIYLKRMIEEEVSAESNTARFASVKVLQKAVVPPLPSSPDYKLMALVAIIVSLALGVGATITIDWCIGMVRRRRA